MFACTFYCNSLIRLMLSITNIIFYSKNIVKVLSLNQSFYTYFNINNIKNVKVWIY